MITKNHYEHYVVSSCCNYYLFQLKSSSEVTDTSGKCKVTYFYESTGIMKTKTDCTSDDLENRKEEDAILGTKRFSSSFTEFKLDSTSSRLKFVKSKELHKIFFSAREEIGSQIEVEQLLVYLKSGNVEKNEASTFESAVMKIETSEKVTFVKDSLLTETENVVSDINSDFSKTVKRLKGSLKTENLGTLKPNKAFLKLVDVARISSREEISKVLSQKKNKDIL